MSNVDHLNSSSRPIGEADRERLRAMILALGEREVIARGRFHKSTLWRICAGLPVYEGTRALVRDLLRPDRVNGDGHDQR
jgi:hypothetical protein